MVSADCRLTTPPHCAIFVNCLFKKLIKHLLKGNLHLTGCSLESVSTFSHSDSECMDLVSSTCPPRELHANITRSTNSTVRFSTLNFGYSSTNCFKVGKLRLSSLGLRPEAERLPSLRTNGTQSGLTDLITAIKL